jgi:hypothetical protein
MHESSPCITPAVREYARGKRDGEQVLRAWVLHTDGALSGAEIARRLEVHDTTARRWINDLTARTASERAKKSAPLDDGKTKPALAVALEEDDLVRKRAELLADAEAAGVRGMAVRQKILQDEGKRLGTDVERHAHVSLQVRLEAMSPQERRGELTDRLARLAARGLLSQDDLAGLITGADEAGRGSPPGRAGAQGQSTTDKSPPNFSDALPAEIVDDESEPEEGAGE